MATNLKYLREILDIRYELNINNKMKPKNMKKARQKTK